MYLLIGDKFILTDGGKLLPADRSTQESSDIVDSLISSKAAVENPDGTFTYSEVNNVLQFAETIAIEENKTRAKALIDAAAGAARAKYITDVPGQAMTYLSKTADCRAFKAAGYPIASIDSYPWAKSQCITSGCDMANLTVEAAQGAVEVILAQEAAWVTIGTSIESIRLTAKAAITALPTSTKRQITAAFAKINNEIVPQALAQLGAL